MQIKYYNLFVFILTFSLFVGCNESKESTHVNIEVRGETLFCKEFDGRIFVGVKDSIFIVQSYSSSWFEIYETKGDSLQKIKNFGTKGQGPNEFRLPVSFFDTKRSKLFVIENYSVLGNGCIIDIKDENVEDKTTWESFDLKWMKSFYGGISFIPKNEDEYLFLGAFPESSSLISIISNSSKTSKPVDFWIDNPYVPNNKSINQSIYVRNAHIFQNTINNKTLYCGGVGRVVYLFDLDGDRVGSLLKIYDEVSPNKTRDGLSFSLTKNTNWDIFARVTDQFIYLRPYKYTKDYADYKGYPFYFSDELEVYDWNGNHVIDMTFDTPFYDFIIDENDQFVLTLTTDLNNDDTIVKRYYINNVSELKK